VGEDDEDIHAPDSDHDGAARLAARRWPFTPFCAKPRSTRQHATRSRDDRQPDPLTTTTAAAARLCLAARGARAQESTRIVAATVYPDSASVERELKVPGGTRHIALACGTQWQPAQGEQLEIALGQDDQMHVDVESPGNFTQSRGVFGGSVERTSTAVYAIINQHPNAVTVEMLDASPVSRTDAIKVHLHLSQ
jgi:hypothetical protein